MNVTRLLVDGYSLLHSAPEFSKYIRSGMEIGRERVLQRVRLALPDLAPEAVVVFDGREGSLEDMEHIQVVYAPAHKTADAVIERMVADSPHPEELLVITADRAERDTAAGFGAQVMSCAQFLELTGRVRTENMPRPRKKKLGTLGDAFPKPR
ncbi:MAG TPA: NYN domain-containing protein [Kiritimatiellia bacterium]|nr:NYN domain-containing protein [Kiritimatiellia bacterium]HQQ04077.1 NYN domain-containing protein [Kiritimatiellia bacterium]